MLRERCNLRVMIELSLTGLVAAGAVAFFFFLENRLPNRGLGFRLGFDLGAAPKLVDGTNAAEAGSGAASRSYSVSTSTAAVGETSFSFSARSVFHHEPTNGRVTAFHVKTNNNNTQHWALQRRRTKKDTRWRSIARDRPYHHCLSRQSAWCQFEVQPGGIVFCFFQQGFSLRFFFVC